MPLALRVYRMRTGCPWRDLPDDFGNWNSIYKRFNEWSQKEILIKIFRELSKDSDCEWKFIVRPLAAANCCPPSADS